MIIICILHLINLEYALTKNCEILQKIRNMYLIFTNKKNIYELCTKKESQKCKFSPYISLMPDDIRFPEPEPQPDSYRDSDNRLNREERASSEERGDTWVLN